MRVEEDGLGVIVNAFVCNGAESVRRRDTALDRRVMMMLIVNLVVCMRCLYCVLVLVDG